MLPYIKYIYKVNYICIFLNLVAQASADTTITISRRSTQSPSSETGTRPTIPSTARVIGYSEEYDLALLQVEGSVKLFDYVEISEYAPLILDRVYAIGNPFNLRNTISSGFISSNSYNKMQMDISINSGNSGGAILNSDGKLVGIALSIIDPSKGSGIGFGATLEQINNFLKDYK